MRKRVVLLIGIWLFALAYRATAQDYTFREVVSSMTQTLSSPTLRISDGDLVPIPQAETPL